MTDKPQIKVGDEYFFYDANRRVYEEGTLGPTYRGHFRKIKITGETSRSWITDNWRIMKVPKSDPWKALCTPEMIDDGEWKHAHAYRISDRVLRDASVEQLREIAKIIGYRND